MPFLMSDVAAGSDAALKLQQNVAAAPDVKQAQANKMQEQQLLLQQEAANVQRSRLANLVAETGIEATAQSKQKLQALFQSPEFQKANQEGNYGDILRMTGATQMQAGDIEGGSKTLAQAETYDAKKLSDQKTALEIADRELTKANAVIQAVAPEKINETFDNLPDASKKAVYAEVGGQAAWSKFSNEEKKTALNNLMMAGLRRTAAQTYTLDTNKQTIIADNRKEVAKINEDKAIKTKIIGEEGANTRASDRLTERTWSDYNNKINTLMGQSNNAIAKAQKRVDDAQLAATHAPAGSISDEKQAKLNQDVKDAMKARDDIQKDYFQRELSVAESAPDSWKDKQRVIDNLKKQLSLVDTPKEESKKGVSTPDKTTTPTESVSKPYLDSKGNVKPDWKRPDGSIKGPGWLGKQKSNSGKDMSEYSIGTEINGKEVDIPTFVPGLTQKEIDFLKTEPNVKDIPDSIFNKAKTHAEKLINAGKSPFKQWDDASLKEWNKGLKVTSNKMTAEQQSWVDRAKAANPGMSEADIIAEGKKKGKL